MYRFLSLLLLSVSSVSVFSQFTKEDTLRGSITDERIWWDVLHYDLKVEVIPDEKYIFGSNEITFSVLSENNETMQIDLQHPLKIDSAFHLKSGIRHTISFKKIASDCYHVSFQQPLETKTTAKILIFYSGYPKEAKNAPWDGGIVWSKDKNGNNFIATACQGLGASAWWPCKDHGYDEPDSGIQISVTTPNHLMNVSNGQLIENRINEKKRTTVWKVKNPINNYGLNFNIGNYVFWDSIYQGKKGPLKMSFYILEDNLEKSKIQFLDAFRTMDAFEHWFGPYPFYEDGYKLVEVPYLGMEHQSSVTYGNGYQNGYLGKDLSGTGWGLKWDFIIVHESGHEWFANNITCKDNADMWIHESFTSYSEALFTEYHYGKTAGYEYVRGLRRNILNDRPIIGTYNVNHEGSYDMYHKGANMLHTIRQLADSDEKWLQLLRGLNHHFYHQTVTTEEIETYMSETLDIDLSAIFDQYLRTRDVPKLEIIKKGKNIHYRWSNCLTSFNMPIDVYIDDGKQRLYPTTKFRKVKGKKLVIDENYYVKW